MKTIDSKPASGATKASSPFFSKDSEQGFFGSSAKEKPFFASNSGPARIQAKLTIGRPGDIYEKEADAMADKVVQRLAEPSVVRTGLDRPSSFTPAVQKKCAHCEQEEKLQKKEEEEENGGLTDELQRKPIFESNAEPPDDEKNIQRKCAECEKEEKLQKRSDPSSSRSDSPGIEQSLHSSKGSGAPLPHHTREQMETSFDADFSGVQIHSNSSAIQMNKALNAQAFTHGNDIYFNSGKYDINSKGGQHLLAHELTHVVQQGAAGGISKKSNITQKKPMIQRNIIGDAWDATGGKLVSGVKAAGSAVADTATSAYNAGADALKSLAMRLAPDLVAFLQMDLVETIKQKIIAAIDSITGGLFSRIQTEGLLSILMQLFGSGISAIGAGIAQGCSELAKAAKALWAFVKKLTGPAIQAFKKLFQKLGSFLSSVWDHFGKPAWEAVKHYAAEAWKWIEDKAIWLWNLTEPVRKAVGEAWTWIKKQFNIAWSNTTSVLDWIKGKLSKAWDWVKAKIQPIIGPLKIIAGIAVMLSPAGPIIAIYYGAPYVWSAIKWLAENFNKYVIVRAKEYLKTKILPAIRDGLATIQSAVRAGMQWMSGLFASAVSAVSGLLTSLSSIAYFRNMRAGINLIIGGIKKGAAFVATKAADLWSWVKSTASRVWQFLSPILELLRELMLVGMFGPLSILDDGVWDTVNKVLKFGMKVPCLREIEGFLDIPLWIQKIGGARQSIKDAWFMFTHPAVLEAKAKAYLEPYIKDVPNQTESYLTKALATVGLATAKHISGILKYLVPSIAHLLANWWDEAKKMIWYLIWPFAEGSPLYTDAPKLWNLIPAIWKNIKEGQFRVAIDGALEWWQAVNSVLGLFAGWMAAGGALVGAILGSFAGGVGAIPGAGAGFEVGLAIGEGIMTSMIAAETIVIGVAVYDLFTVTDDGEEATGKPQPVNPATPPPNPPVAPPPGPAPASAEQEGENKSFNSQNVKTGHDRIQYAYQRIGNSALTLGIMGALILLGAVGGEIAEALMGAVKKIGTFIGEKLPGVAKFVTSAGEALGESKFMQGLKEAKSEFNRGREMVKKRGEPLPEDSPATKGINDDISSLESKVNDPANIREVTDPKFAEEFDVEVEVGEHKFRRRKDNHNWCRFSEPTCLIGMDDVNAKVNDVTAKAKEGTLEKPGDKNWKQVRNFQKWTEGGGKILEHPDGSFTLIDKDGTTVKFDPQGEPDFSAFLDDPWKIREVELDEGFANPMDKKADFKKANIKAGHPEWGSSSPPDYTWHHLRDQKTLQLVPRKLHSRFQHIGQAVVP